MADNKFKRNIASVGVTQGIVFVISFIMGILNARILGPEGVGVFALLRLMQQLGVKITDLGFGRALRYYSANGQIPYQDLKRTVIELGLIIGLGVIVLSMILKFLPINVWNDININVYLLFLPAMFFYVLTMYLRHLLHGQLLIMTYNVSLVFERVAYVALFLFFVVYLDLGLIGVSLALSISAIFLFIQLLRKALIYRKPASKNIIEIHNRKERFNVLWRYGRWSYFSQFIEYIYQHLPVILLKSTVTDFSIIGFFNKAKSLAEYPRQPAVPLSGLLFSYNAGSDGANASNRTNTLSKFSFWLVTVFFFTLGIFIKPVIRILYGVDFLPAADVFYWLYPSSVFYILSVYMTSAIAAMGHNKLNFIVKVRSLFVILPIVTLLIYWKGMIGAAAGMSFTFTLLFVQYAREYCKLSETNPINLFWFNRRDILMVKGLINKAINRNV